MTWEPRTVGSDTNKRELKIRYSCTDAPTNTRPSENFLITAWTGWPDNAAVVSMDVNSWQETAHTQAWIHVVEQMMLVTKYHLPSMAKRKSQSHDHRTDEHNSDAWEANIDSAQTGSICTSLAVHKVYAAVTDEAVIGIDSTVGWGWPFDKAADTPRSFKASGVTSKPSKSLQWYKYSNPHMICSQVCYPKQ